MRYLRLRALDRKLVRDLVEMKGQALAIALVVAAGAMFTMYLSNFDSLRRTQRAYYDRQRFARLQPLEIGRMGGSDAQVLSGVELGAQVVVHPGDTVSDGARVRSAP